MSNLDISPEIESEFDDEDFILSSPKKLKASTVVLCSLLMLGIGFYGGMKYGQSNPASTSGNLTGATSRFSGTAGQGGIRATGSALRGGAVSKGFSSQFGSALSGTVANISGNTLYITESSGNTVEVTTSGSTFTQTTPGSVNDVLPGDTVLIRGSQQSNGSYEATSVSINPSVGGGLGGLFGQGLSNSPTASPGGGSSNSPPTTSSNSFGPFG